MPPPATATRVLVVDDEPVIVGLVQALLARDGFDIVGAGSIADAMRAMLEGEVALAIVDKNLPDGSGIEIIAELRRRWPRCETIVFTGYPSFESVVDALRAGAFDYVTKPADVNELKHKVALALERRTLLLERERTLRELEEAHRLQALAAHSEMMAQLGRQLAGIVHEVRSPLAAVRAYVTQAVNAGDARVKELLDGALRGVDQIAAVTLDVRRVSSLAAFQPALRERVAIRPVIDSAVNLTRAETRDAAALTVTHDGEGVVLGAAVRLTQAIVNLLVNAAQAMTRYGKIEVATHAGGGRVRVTVADDGRGIPADVLARIFEPFFTTRPEGTGLGLSLARQIVVEHGGTLDVTSTPGGTTFVIDLPAAPAEK